MENIHLLKSYARKRTRMNEPQEKYVVAFDVSPSEQLNDNDDEIKVMGVVFSLNDAKSFELVGNKFPNESARLDLKKWSSSKSAYKTKLVEHAKTLIQSKNVLFGSNIASNRKIREIGEKYWKQIKGPIPTPSSFNAKGRPRVKLEVLGGEENRIDEIEMLIDDLYIIGWYAEAIVRLCKTLCDLKGKSVNLDVLIDKFPNEQGGHYKVSLLREICSKASGGRVNIVGFPCQSDHHQRDLLTDNIAGLGRELKLNPDSELVVKFNDIYSVTSECI